MSGLALMATVHGAAAAGEKAGLVALALLAAAAVLLRPPLASARVRAGAMLGTLVVTPVLLAIDIWHASPMVHLRAHPALAVGVVVAGIAVVVALAALFRHRPSAFPLLAVFTLPFRLPISSAGTTANLLVPLYLVVAGGVLAYVWPMLRGGQDEGASELRAAGAGASAGVGATTTATAAESPSEPAGATSAAPSDRLDHRTGAVARTGTPANAGEPTAAVWFSDPLYRHRDDGEENGSARRPLPRWLAPLARPFTLEALLMGFVVLYALQATYSTDFSKALQNAVFFYVPFALLFGLLRDVRWTRRLLLQCGAVAVGLAVLFSGVGFVEYARKSLFLNPRIVAANVYDNYFRVNSFFFDPNIYGRFLALVMVVVATVVLWTRRRRDIWIAAAVLAWLWAGLITSFSQSSMVALIAGLVMLAGWRWSWRWTLGSAAALLAAALLLLFAAPASLHFGTKGSGSSLNTATSGRVKLIKGGAELFLHRPLAGYGSGSFAPEYRAHLSATTAAATSASHTTPVTIAAEQGLIGLLVYVALMLAALFTLFTDAGRSPPRIAIAACFAALAVHTLAYADFLEDPFTWTLLGIGIALAVAQRASGPERRTVSSAAPSPMPT